jgi:predicted protein tyrosine phosphatase
MRIAVTSYWFAEEQARVFSPSFITSIMDPGARSPTFRGAIPHLQINFHDIDKSQDEKTAPSPEAIKLILEFATKNILVGNRRVLIHCMAGVSRSPAAAYILAVMVRRDDPVRAAHVLFQSAPFVDPNLLMIRHADAMGQYKGSMLRAIKSANKAASIALAPKSFQI